jgi:Domain of unknown function (DUF4340)
MNRGRLGALIVAALLVISIALVLSTRRNTSLETRDALLFPNLAGELATVSSVDVRKGSATPAVTLLKQGEQWTVKQRANYPADVSKLRKLLLSLSDAKIVEEKTSDPGNYSVIGVDDPSKANAVGAQVDFTVKDGSHSLIVGKPSGESNFLRRSSEKTSYLVAPGIYVESEPRLWIDTKLIDIPADNIDRIEYKPVTGTPYSVHRVAPPAPPAPPAPAPAAASAAAAASTPAAAAAAPTPATAPASPPQPPEYVLEGAPAGRKPADSPTLAPSPGVFGNVTADDVAAVAEIDFGKPASMVLIMKDGSSITLTGTVIGDKHWIQISAPKDEALMGRVSGRAFQIPGYRYDGLFRPLEQLLVPKPAPPDKNAKPESPTAKPSKPAATKQPAQAP